MGRIGICLAKKALGFGCRILYHNRSKRCDDDEYNGKNIFPKMPEIHNFSFLAEYFKNLDEMLPLCDFVCALTDETKDLVTYKHFELMKKSAIFCNISRGDTVKQDDLLNVSLRFNV